MVTLSNGLTACESRVQRKTATTDNAGSIRARIVRASRRESWTTAVSLGLGLIGSPRSRVAATMEAATKRETVGFRLLASTLLRMFHESTRDECHMSCSSDIGLLF